MLLECPHRIGEALIEGVSRGVSTGRLAEPQLLQAFADVSDPGSAVALTQQGWGHASA